MNKFKKEIDKIKLSDFEKQKMLNNILNHKEKSFNFNKLVVRLATFLLAFTLVIGGSYALIKVFNLDDKIKDLYDLDDDTVKQIDGTNLNITKEFSDIKVNIIQTITSDYNIYIRLDVIGKNELVYINDHKLVKGDNIDYDNNQFSYGLSLITEGNLTNKTNSYLLDYSYESDFEAGLYTLRLYNSEEKYYDIPINISKNDINKKKTDIKEVIYNKNDLVLETNYVTLSNDSIIINYSASNSNILENFDIYGEQFESFNIKYKNDTTENLYLMLNFKKLDDGTYNSIFSIKKNFLNINNVKSIIINGVELKISD